MPYIDSCNREIEDIELDNMRAERQVEHRIVIIDNMIIAQFFSCGWWACSKANNNDENDFAVWPLSEANMAKAVKLVGNVPLIRSDLKPETRPGHRLYGQDLRELARSIT